MASSQGLAPQPLLHRETPSVPKQFTKKKKKAKLDSQSFQIFSPKMDTTILSNLSEKSQKVQELSAEDWQTSPMGKQIKSVHIVHRRGTSEKSRTSFSSVLGEDLMQCSFC